eukprot:8201745-Prorocentrum_lima.AAC.1
MASRMRASTSLTTIEEHGASSDEHPVTRSSAMKLDGGRSQATPRIAWISGHRSHTRLSPL